MQQQVNINSYVGFGFVFCFCFRFSRRISCVVILFFVDHWPLTPVPIISFYSRQHNFYSKLIIYLAIISILLNIVYINYFTRVSVSSGSTFLPYLQISDKYIKKEELDMKLEIFIGLFGCCIWENGAWYPSSKVGLGWDMFRFIRLTETPKNFEISQITNLNTWLPFQMLEFI